MNRKCDSALRSEVSQELKWDSRVGSARPAVDVSDGVVTLRGNVTSYSQKLAAQKAAHRVAGVLDVANDIKVRPEGIFERSDTDIAHAVRQSLEWDALVPDECIKSTVSDGWVTLEGEVDFWHQRENAENTVLRLKGVIGVTNEIAVAPRVVDAKELREEIESALERRADRQAERLRIEVSDGEVDLFGRVHSWQEKRAVLGSISHAPGVNSVRDHLRVDPYF
ncbi:MAG TPA: BON domain-containing protein [Pyrinomonadaceae bacterium]|nr:BON domain-containing protein [Pyrinomonadaceae bacterium]